MHDAAQGVSRRMQQLQQQLQRHDAIAAHAHESGISADAATKLAREGARLRFCLAQLQRWEVVLDLAQLPREQAERLQVVSTGEPDALHRLAMAHASAYGGFEDARAQFPEAGDLKLERRAVYDARQGVA